MFRLFISVLISSLSFSGIAVAQFEDTDCEIADRRIVVETLASIDIADVWDMWTTKDGLERFFGPEAEIDPEVGGKFSIHFFPDNPPGQRGAEDMIILAFEPQKRLSFTWNAPVMFPHARSQFTVVTVTFTTGDAGKTKLRLAHNHFGDGYDWDETFAYFSKAWSGQVIPYFLYALEHGGVAWGEMDVPPVNASIISC
ncbi:MAG: SRPBCC domain-containing protein [Pseudomonadota bacterium]